MQNIQLTAQSSTTCQARGFVRWGNSDNIEKITTPLSHWWLQRGSDSTKETKRRGNLFHSSKLYRNDYQNIVILGFQSMTPYVRLSKKDCCLLSNPNPKLTLDRAIEISTSIEMAARDTQQLGASSHVHRLSFELTWLQQANPATAVGIQHTRHQRVGVKT